MTEHIKWWNTLPDKKKRKLADEYQWTTVDKITDYQIELIYLETQSY